MENRGIFRGNGRVYSLGQSIRGLIETAENRGKTPAGGIIPRIETAD
jgi:hypothetical protein